MQEIRGTTGIGCDLRCVSWFTSYLTNRSQCVRVGDTCSGFFPINRGTPQGSVIGSFIFIIYLDHVLKVIESDCSCRPVVYADDSSLIFDVSRKLDSAELHDVQLNIERAIDIFNQFGLVVNSGKTKIVLFHDPHRNIDFSERSMLINGSSIPFSDRAVCLGVLLHHHMEWLSHVRHISGQCFAIITSISRLRRTGVGTPLLVTIYEALLEPILSYCISLWGSSYNNVIKSAQVIQNAAIRAITGRPRSEPIAEVYPGLGLLDIRHLTRLNQNVLVFKSRTGVIPACGPFDFDSKRLRETHRRCSLRVPRPRTALSSHSLRYRLPHEWNGLSPSIKSASTTKHFRKRLKKKITGASSARCI